MTRITKDVMVALPIGAVLPVRCESAAEFAAAYQNALHIRRKHPRQDGGVYNIRSSVKDMTVVVSVVPKEGSDETC